MKILAIVILLGLSTAAAVYGTQTGSAAENGGRNAALDRTCVMTQAEHHAAAVPQRESTPAPEPSGVTPAKPTTPEQMMRMGPGTCPGPNMPGGAQGAMNCPNGPSMMHEGMQHEMHHPEMHHPAMHHSMHHR